MTIIVTIISYDELESNSNLLGVIDDEISFYLRALLNHLLCLNDLLIDRFSLSKRNIPHTLSYTTKDHC